MGQELGLLPGIISVEKVKDVRVRVPDERRNKQTGVVCEWHDRPLQSRNLYDMSQAHCAGEPGRSELGRRRAIPNASERCGLYSQTTIELQCQSVRDYAQTQPRPDRSS
jgi:hypothetical protein